MTIQLKEVEPFIDNEADEQNVNAFLRTLTGNESFEFENDEKPQSVMFSHVTNKLPKWGQLSGYLINIPIDQWDAAFQFLTPEAVYENHVIGKITIERGENIEGVVISTEKLDLKF